jgi:putative copper resistance protein D
LGFALSGWEAALLLSKLGVFVGMLASAGGVLALRGYHDGSRAGHTRLLAYSLFGAVIGLHASVLQVLLQAGQINAAGVMGMFDLNLIFLLRGTPVWDAAAYRGVGFALSVLLVLNLLRVLTLQRATPPVSFYRIALVGQSLALGLVAYGFTQLGHISVTTPLAKIALILHVAAMGGWVGMLLPLRWCCSALSNASLAALMQRFSRLGIALVIVLLSTGGVLLLTLVSPSELFTTDYGQLLLLKLGLFGVLVGIAAMNKLRYVPQLLTVDRSAELPSRLALRVSIDREIAIAVALLVLTTVVSTLLGPAAHTGM